MGNIDHAAAASPQLADDGEKSFGLPAGQRRGRFVHDEGTPWPSRVVEESGGDLDYHAIADGQASENRLRSDVFRAEPDKRGARPVVQRAPVDEPTPAPRIGAPEIKVLRHAQPRRDIQFLMKEAQAQAMRVARVADRRGRARDGDLSAVGFNHTGQDPDQRALAGAILADERMRLADVDHQRGIAKRDRAPIGLGEADDRNEAQWATPFDQLPPGRPGDVRSS